MRLPPLGIATRDWALGFLDERGHPTLGGSGHYRAGLPARALAEAGHEVYLGRLVAHNQVPRLGVKTWTGRVEYPPVMVLQRWMNSDLPPRIRAAREAGQVILSDVDDWWEGLDPANRAWTTTDPKASAEENRDHYRATLAASDAIVCSTPFLADRYRRLAPTHLVRNVVDLDRWPPPEPRGGPPTLGWVGALPWRSKGDVEALAGFLGPFCARHGLRVVHAGHLPGVQGPDGRELPTFAEAAGLARREVGDDGQPVLVSRQGVEVQTLPMRPSTEIPLLWQGMDVALVPLADKPFNEAKSAIAGMSAAAGGLPFVASASPEYRWLRGEHGIGRVARKPADWVRHLTALLDPEVRAAEGAENRRRVAALGLDRLRADWEAVLAKVTDRVPA